MITVYPTADIQLITGSSPEMVVNTISEHLFSKASFTKGSEDGVETFVLTKPFLNLAVIVRRLDDRYNLVIKPLSNAIPDQEGFPADFSAYIGELLRSKTCWRILN
jgi:hypothetical protein